MRQFNRVTITEKGEQFIRGGHVWVYAEEITATSENIEDGDLVDVYTKKEKYLGTGFYNSHSKIRVRIVSKNANDSFDEAFWERKLKWAIQYRKDTMSEEDFSCCRLVFGEADAFPGFTVDRFDRTLVTQVLSLGIEKRKDVLYQLLLKVLREDFGIPMDGIYERNDVAIRELEGMEQYKGVWTEDSSRVSQDGKTMIAENGVIYTVDFVNGQKTGFFLDQKYNRRSIRNLANGKKVLDCFTHTGSFALNAAQAGAREVVAVDISEDALDVAKANAKLNGVENKIQFICDDVFHYLDELSTHGKCDFDLLILDPPAFTKSRDTLKNAIKGYTEINYKAMKLLKRGAYFATCSCSHFMTETYFKQMLHNAAEKAGVSLRQIEARQQSCDHPILWNIPETEYLKFFIFQII